MAVKEILGLSKTEKGRAFRITLDGPRHPDGSRNQISIVFRGTKTAAKEEEQRLKSLSKRGQLVDSKKITVKEFALQCATEDRGRLSSSTCRRYESLMNVYVFPEIGNIRIQKLTRTDIMNMLEAWKAYKVQGGKRAVNPTTLHHAYGAVSSLIKRAMEAEIVYDNVTTRISSRARPKRQRYRGEALDQIGLHHLINALQVHSKRSVSRGGLSAEPAFAAAVMFSVGTGARRGECLALQWRDVNLDKSEVLIKGSLLANGTSLEIKCTKTDRDRSIVLPKSLIKVLRDLRRWQKTEMSAHGGIFQDKGFVFARTDGSPIHPDRFSEAFRHFCERSDIDIRFHDLRHTHASLLGQQGVSMKVVSERLGHSSVAITSNIYSHVFRDQDRHASDVFEELLVPISPQKMQM